MGLRLRVTRIHKQYRKIVLTHLHHVIADATLGMHTVLKKNVEQIALYTTMSVMHALLDFSIQSKIACNVHHVDLDTFQL
jgi:hypothetical protein